MGASLQGFNLVGIERHFNVFLELTIYLRGAFAPDGRLCQNRPVLDVSPSRVPWKGDRVSLPVFHDFRRYQMRADAANVLELQGNPKKGLAGR
jgi:hypothetical protein